MKKLLVVLAAILVLGMPCAHAYNIARVTNTEAWNGVTEFDLDSIKVIKYEPPIYEISLNIIKNTEWKFVYRLNYETKEVARSSTNSLGKPFWYREQRDSVHWKIATKAWEHYYNMRFYISADEWIEKGNELYNQKKYNEAIEAYQSAYDVDNQNAIACYGTGNSYDEIKDYGAAIEWYRKAIAIKPDFDYAYNNMGSAYYKQNKYDDAIESYKQTIKINPKHKYAYLNLARSYLSKEDYKQALKFAKKSVEMNSGRAQDYYIRGLCYEKLNKYKDALNDFEKAVKLDPQNKTYVECRDRVKGNVK